MERPDLESYDVQPADLRQTADDMHDDVSWEELEELEYQTENRPRFDFKYNTLATYNDTQAQYEMAGEIPPYPIRWRRWKRRGRGRRAGSGLAP